MVPSWILDEVAQQLVLQAECKQIHQLAFAATQRRWPEDPNLLDLYRLRDLVQDLTRTHSSFEALKQALRQALSQAPESKSFIPAARTLLKFTKQAYANDSSSALLPSEASLANFAPPVATAGPPLSPFETQASQQIPPAPVQPLPYDDIAAALAQSPSATRIKKLLYAVCSGEWSNDTVLLGRFRLPNLLKQLHRISLQPEDLRNNLNQVVVTLNRPREYELVADIIQRECQRLYGSIEAIAPNTSLGNEEPFTPAASQPVPVGFEAIEAIEDNDELEPTGVILSSAQGSHDEALAQPFAHQPPYASPEPYAAPDYNPSYAAATATPVLTADLATAETLATSTTLATTASPASPLGSAFPAQTTPIRPMDWQSLAELRVELMRYANPLRVKALIFSTIYYPFDISSGTDRSKLQTETLGDLLLRLVAQFKNHSSLEEQLQRIASQLMPTDEYGQAAGAIARALRPFYP